MPGREDDRGGGALRGELRERAEAEEVVGEAGGEDERDRAVDADERLVRVEGADRGGAPEPGAEADEDADPAEARRRGGVPAVGRGNAISRLAAGERSSAQIATEAAGRAIIARAVPTGH